MLMRERSNLTHPLQLPGQGQVVESKYALFLSFQYFVDGAVIALGQKLTF